MLDIGIVILTQDFRLAYKIQSLLKGRYSRIIHTIYPSDVLSTDIVITTHKEFLNLKFEKVLRFTSHKSVTLTTLLNGINSLFSTKNNGLCLIGFDPGKNIGVGMIMDGAVLWTRVFREMDKMVVWLKSQLNMLRYNELIFRIGDGGGQYQEELVDLLFKEFGHLGIFELVNETRTSVKTAKRSLHEEAALRIAKRYGVRIEEH